MGNQIVSKVALCDGSQTEWPTFRSEPDRSHKDFLLTLFRSLDSTHVRYCVLHSWEGLPEELVSDLDIAVDPDDVEKLRSVFRLLLKKGYTPLPPVNYFVDAFCFRFVWFDAQMVICLAVDVIFKHQKGVLITPSVERLLSGRIRHGTFWIPAPESEFAYLLARRAWKGTATPKQRRRLQLLVEQLGLPTAERLAKELFLGKVSVPVVAACAAGSLNPLLSRLKAEIWKTSLVRNPLRLLVNLVSDGLRRVRRWLHPTGCFVVVMGPDGVGKSTLIKHLEQTVDCAFNHTRLFHWRPMLLWRRKTTRDTTKPHSLASHGRCRSIAGLFAQLSDYWLGYWLLIRPLVSRSGLVIFDRYFDDVRIDPKRYRYGGPLWLVRSLGYLVPKPDLILVLDAPEEVVFSRKQEIDTAELGRQRRLYAACKGKGCITRVIDASGSILQVTHAAAGAVIDQLSQRGRCQNGRWFLPDHQREPASCIE